MERHTELALRLIGPPGTPYEGGVFQVDIVLSDSKDISLGNDNDLWMLGA